MDAKVKVKWLEALRSGNYKQGRRVLKTREGTFCCLGVLCDISGKGKFQETASGYIVFDTGVYGGKWETMLSDAYIQELGISNAEQSQLMRMNDGYAQPEGEIIPSKSFEEIATYIEENL